MPSRLTAFTMTGFAAALAFGVATAAMGQSVATDAANRTLGPGMRVLDVHVGGRVAVEPLGTPAPKGARSYVHEWPGVYFEAAFSGDRVVLKFDDPYNEYRLLIDERAPVAIAQPGTVETLVSGLGDGPHRLRLEKVTESVGLGGAFQGFYVPASERPLPVKTRTRQIEFIGDSGMTGYGNRSATRTCTKEEVRLTTDTQQAYPALVARHFDADYQINAVSGRGLVRNYAGVEPDMVMSKIYPRVLPRRLGVYADTSWRPQVIVVGLLADWATPPGAGERWKTPEAMAPDYAKAYGPLIAELHRRSPAATVLIYWPDGPMLGNDQTRRLFDGMKAVVVREAKAVGARVAFFAFDTQGITQPACDYHAGLDDARKLADWMIGYIDARPRIWGR
jgi:carbohydrate esterase-like protein